MKSRISVLSTSDVKVVQLNQIRNHFLNHFLILCWEIVSRDFYLVLQNYTLGQVTHDKPQYVSWYTDMYIQIWTDCTSELNLSASKNTLRHSTTYFEVRMRI